MDFRTHIADSGSCIDTVRALHQTITSLRAALEESRSEIAELKSNHWPLGPAEDALRNLSIENHLLRRELLSNTSVNEKFNAPVKENNNNIDTVSLKFKDKGLNRKPISENSVRISTEKVNTLHKPPNKKGLLSTSKIVTFSNTFEGDRQILTSNSLHVRNLQKSGGEAAENRAIINREEGLIKNKQKSKRKNITFHEEPVKSKEEVVCSTSNGVLPKNIQKGLKYIDSALEICEASTNIIAGDLEVKEIESKSVISQVQEEKITSLAEIPTRRRSSILGEQVEAALLSYINGKADEKVNVIEIKEKKNLDTPTKEPDQDEKILESCDVVQDEKLPELQSNEKIVKEVLEGVVETLEVQNEEDLEETETKNKDTSTITKQVSEKNRTKKEKSKSLVTKDVNLKETKDLNFTSSKQVEVSVRISKKAKKSLEIDIQTTSKRHREARMNGKQQKSEEIPPVPPLDLGNLIDEESCSPNAKETSFADDIGNDAEQEVDDIELIFTTDETKEGDFKEELVPIETYGENQMLQCPLSDYDEKLSAEASDRELEDDVFNDNFENENQENSNFQSQNFDFNRDNSQMYNSKSDNSINHEDKSMKSYYSYQDSSFENKSLEKDESFDRFEEKVRIIETDISKIGIQDVEYNLGRRNTCPNPIQYRPIMHREALGRSATSRKARPFLAHSNVRKDSGAQTDISAIPGSSWRSESNLARKIKPGDHFTTLPSKFPHPASRLRLSEKTVEARRVLLSDIGFTSMVPELSRSADHLCPPAAARGPITTSYGQFLRTTDLYSPAYTSQKFAWTTTTPSEGSHSQSRYSSQYPLASPPAPTRRCSAPVSPSKRMSLIKTTPSRVRFANGSLPELRSDWNATGDSGESTDSLVEEAEHYLRRSIDCLAPYRDSCFKSEPTKTHGIRRASAPEPARDNVPPQGWQPFLPRVPRDLHLDYWVKVISLEGRVRGGRVRYVGPLMNQTETFVGVQLSTPDGQSDGTYNNRRYFNCEPHHGLFVPFKKIIMGWRP